MKPSIAGIAEGVKQLLRASSCSLVAVCTLLLGSGCVSYSVESDPSQRGNLQMFDADIKERFKGWRGLNVATIGADRNGFTIIKEVARSEGGNTVILLGKPVTYKWDDVKNVQVYNNCAGLFMGGVLDPTIFSHVTLKLADGEELTIGPRLRFYHVVLICAPFWPLYPTWLRNSSYGRDIRATIDARGKE